MAKPSLVRQVEMAVNSINKIGQSKRSDKLVGKTSKGLYSVRYVKDVLVTSKEFAKWLREQHNVRMMKEIRESHYREYIEMKKGAGVSAGTLYNIESHLRKLNAGARVQFGFKRDFVSEKRVVNTNVQRETRNRSVDERTFQKYIDFASKNVVDVVQLQYRLGLRVREACNIRVEHVVQTNDGLAIEIRNGKGITKGGRGRYIPVPRSFENELMSMISGKLPEQKIANVSEATVMKTIQRFNLKAENKIDGSHAFRHSYARNRFEGLLGFEAGEGYAYLADRIAKNDVSSYDADLVSKIESAMDIVHAELGHGNGRYDLARVYLQR